MLLFFLQLFFLLSAVFELKQARLLQLSDPVNRKTGGVSI